MRQGQAVQYLAGSDRYVVDMPDGRDPLILSGDTAREMVRAYSNWDGSPLNIDEMCRRWGVTRNEFVAIKKAFGWTHTHEPFTMEEIGERPDEELIQDALAQKRQRVARDIQRRAWKETEKDAQLWRDRGETIAQRVEGAASLLAGSYEPPTRPKVRARREPYLLVVSPTDLHYGKSGWAGYGPGAYGRDICRERLFDAVDRILGRLPRLPEKILLPVGSDWFHVDSSKGTTTRGTPQDMDGTPEQIVAEGIGLALDLVEMLAQVAPVDLVLQAGNHDNLMSIALFAAMRRVYRDRQDVRCLGDYGPYQTYTYGDCLLGITHGHGRNKPEDLGPLLASREPEAWGRSKHRYWLTGNLHHYTVAQRNGTVVFLLPSLSGSDRYHQTHWPEMAPPAMQALALHPQEGHVLTVVSSVLVD